ncbi:MAG TPA: amidohydrolase family protein [Thermoanaerobaculia bacterium]|nr:amidohydrolase family protein [Thermoanaerobaculia bacterium]
MIRRARMSARRLAAGAAVLLLSATAAAIAQGSDIAVRGGTIHTLTGPPIRDGVVLVRDGKIAAVGPAASVPIPDGIEVLEAVVVTPGLIDAHSTLGLSGIYNSNVGQVRDQDQLETSAPIQPELRAIDAYDAREKLIEYARGFGVTTIHTGHGPGALISGQTMIAKTRGDSTEEAVVVPFKMLAFTLGNGLSREFKSPGTSAKGVAMLREALLEARQYLEKRETRTAATQDDGEGDGEGEGDEKGGGEAARNLRHEALAALLQGEVTALVTAHSAPEIEAALRLQEEFDFPMVIDGAAEAPLLLEEIAAAGVAVLPHPPMARLRQGSFETAAKLRDAGIPFALQSGFEGYVPKTRVLLFEAAIAAANGLGFDDALASITREPAQLLGIADRVGTLEVGKDGDLALFDGDPFEYTSHVCAVVIEGEVVSRECR